MNSSYKSKIDYSALFKLVCFLKKPKKIVEFGILNGYSLYHMCNSVDKECHIVAYDIFEKFNGNGADYKTITKMFKNNKNVSIQRGDFYKAIEKIENNSIDILHVDIANNGDVYEFVFTQYIKKLSKGGIIILEGGSKERDNVEWIKKYNKPPLKPVLDKYKNDFSILTVDNFPSITFVQKK